MPRRSACQEKPSEFLGYSKNCNYCTRHQKPQEIALLRKETLSSSWPEIPKTNTKKKKGGPPPKKKHHQILALKIDDNNVVVDVVFSAPRCPSNSPRERWHSHSQLTIYPSQMLLARKQVRSWHRSRWPQAFLPIPIKAVEAGPPTKKSNTRNKNKGE